MPPTFTLITPTIQRESLIRCCASVAAQSLTDWQHLIVMDCAIEDVNSDLMFSLAHPCRRFYCCGQRYNDFGNSPRHQAYEFATGDFAYYLDDDNVFSDSDALERMSDALAGAGCLLVSIFPIIREGQRFFNDPPGLCLTDTANFCLRRQIAQWPAGPEYEMDGILIERLVKEYGYEAFPDVEPIVVMEKSNHGK